MTFATYASRRSTRSIFFSLPLSFFGMWKKEEDSNFFFVFPLTEVLASLWFCQWILVVFGWFFPCSSIIHINSSKVPCVMYAKTVSSKMNRKFQTLLWLSLTFLLYQRRFYPTFNSQGVLQLPSKFWYFGIHHKVLRSLLSNWTNTRNLKNLVEGFIFLFFQSYHVHRYFGVFKFWKLLFFIMLSLLSCLHWRWLKSIANK